MLSRPAEGNHMKKKIAGGLLLGRSSQTSTDQRTRSKKQNEIDFLFIFNVIYWRLQDRK